MLESGPTIVGDRRRPMLERDAGHCWRDRKPLFLARPWGPLLHFAQRLSDNKSNTYMDHITAWPTTLESEFPFLLHR